MGKKKDEPEEAELERGWPVLFMCVTNIFMVISPTLGTGKTTSARPRAREQVVAPFASKGEAALS